MSEIHWLSSVSLLVRRSKMVKPSSVGATPVSWTSTRLGVPKRWTSILMWSIYSRDIWFGCEFSDLRMGFMWDLYMGCLCGLYIVIWCYLTVKYRYRDYNPHKFRIWGPYGEIYPRTVHWNCTSTVAEITWNMCMACIYSIIFMYIPRGYMMIMGSLPMVIFWVRMYQCLCV